MMREAREVSLRDWLGWIFVVLLTLVGALSTIAWNGLKERVVNLELYGSTPLRLEVSNLKTQVSEQRRELDDASRDLRDLREQLQILQYNYEPNAAAPPRPRFQR